MITKKMNWGLVGRWLLAFLGFPIGGGLTYLVLGTVDNPLKAIVGGALTGAILGGVQFWALRPSFAADVRWIAFTCVGLAAGLGLAVAFVGVGVDMNSIITRAALTGLLLGAAQAVVWRRHAGASVWWLVAVTLAYTLAWPVTSLVIKDNVQMGYVVFGSSGAILFQLVTLVALLRQPRAH